MKQYGRPTLNGRVMKLNHTLALVLRKPVVIRRGQTAVFCDSCTVTVVHNVCRRFILSNTKYTFRFMA